MPIDSGRMAKEIIKSHSHFFAITGGGYYPSMQGHQDNIAKALDSAYAQGRREMKEECKMLAFEMASRLTPQDVAKAIAKLEA